MPDNRVVIATHCNSCDIGGHYKYYDAVQISKFYEIERYAWAPSKHDSHSCGHSTDPLVPSKRLIEPPSALQSKFPFFSLPPELRTIVLEIVFTDHTLPRDNIYEDRHGRATTTIIVDRTDEITRKLRDRQRLASRGGPGGRFDTLAHFKTLYPSREFFDAIYIYLPANFVQLFVSMQFFEEALDVFAKGTPLTIAKGCLARVIPLLSQYPVLQRVIEVSATRARSLAMSTIPLDIPYNLSFPSSQLFQHLKIIHLYYNQRMSWKISNNQMSFLAVDGADWRGEDAMRNHKVPLLDVLEHNDKGKCFEELKLALQPAISSTARYRNAKALLASFAKHNIRPQILFWQEVHYGVHIEKELLSKLLTDDRTSSNYLLFSATLARTELLVVAVDIANFDVVHFDASGYDWTHSHRAMMSRASRLPALQSSLKHKYNTLARRLWPDRTFGFTSVRLQPAIIEQQHHARSVFEFDPNSEWA